MAERARSREITDWAYAALVNCRATHRIVAEVSERWGLSSRQSRRYVSRAYARLRDDIAATDLDQEAMLCKMICSLEQAVEAGIAKGNGSTVIGATRLLAELLGLGQQNNRDARRWGHSTGRRYG